MADLKDKIQHHKDIIEVEVDEQMVGNSILSVHRSKNKASMQAVWYSSSLPRTSVTGVMATIIGHISARHLQDGIDEVEDAGDAVEGEETEVEEEDRMEGRPCWCSQNQQL